MVDNKDLLPIDPRSIKYVPATLISNPEVVALGRGEFTGMMFVYTCSASPDLERSKEIATGVSRQGVHKGVIGPDINAEQSRLEMKPIYNHQSLGLWGEIKMEPEGLAKFKAWIFGGLDG